MEEMDLLRAIAPCGLVCYTCTASQDGVIRSLSAQLLDLLEGYESFAERFAGFEPRLAKYPEFVDVLRLFSEARCQGCRSGMCPMPGCPISPCVVAKGLGYCSECDDFPCDKADGMPRELRLAWLTHNRRMRRIGVEAYWAEMRDKPHYAS